MMEGRGGAFVEGAFGVAGYIHPQGRGGMCISQRTLMVVL